MRFNQHLIGTALTSLLFLAACGNNPSPTATTAASPPAPDSQKPVVKPLAKSLNKSAGASPSTVSGGKFLEVKVGNLETYTHKTGLFQIDMPKDWKPTEKGSGNEVGVLWFDPTQNATVVVNIFSPGKPIPSDAMVKLLQSFLQKQFGTRPGFTMDAPTPQPDGSIQVVWGYTETIKGVTGRVQGNSFIEQRDDKISLLTVGVIEQQFDRLKEPLTKIVNSYKIKSSVKLSP